MENIKTNKIEENITSEIEQLKKEVEQLKEELTNATKTIEQYETAYKELVVKFNRLYSILNITIEHALEIK